MTVVDGEFKMNKLAKFAAQASILIGIPLVFLSCWAFWEREPSIFGTSATTAIFAALMWRCVPAAAGVSARILLFLAAAALSLRVWTVRLPQTDKTVAELEILSVAVLFSVAILFLMVVKSPPSNARLVRLQNLVLLSGAAFGFSECILSHGVIADGAYWSGQMLDMPILSRIHLPSPWDLWLFDWVPSMVWITSATCATCLSAVYLVLQRREKRLNISEPRPRPLGQ